jgi:hypothetical protein
VSDDAITEWLRLGLRAEVDAWDNVVIEHSSTGTNTAQHHATFARAHRKPYSPEPFAVETGTALRSAPYLRLEQQIGTSGNVITYDGALWRLWSPRSLLGRVSAAHDITETTWGGQALLGRLPNGLDLLEVVSGPLRLSRADGSFLLEGDLDKGDGLKAQVVLTIEPQRSFFPRKVSVSYSGVTMTQYEFERKAGIPRVGDHAIVIASYFLNDGSTKSGTVTIDARCTGFRQLEYSGCQLPDGCMARDDRFQRLVVSGGDEETIFKAQTTMMMAMMPGRIAGGSPPERAQIVQVGWWLAFGASGFLMGAMLKSLSRRRSRIPAAVAVGMLAIAVERSALADERDAPEVCVSDLLGKVDREKACGYWTVRSLASLLGTDVPTLSKAGAGVTLQEVRDAMSQVGVTTSWLEVLDKDTLAQIKGPFIAFMRSKDPSALGHFGVCRVVEAANEDGWRVAVYEFPRPPGTLLPDTFMKKWGGNVLVPTSQAADLIGRGGVGPDAWCALFGLAGLLGGLALRWERAV